MKDQEEKPKSYKIPAWALSKHEDYFTCDYCGEECIKNRKKLEIQKTDLVFCSQEHRRAWYSERSMEIYRKKKEDQKQKEEARFLKKQEKYHSSYNMVKNGGTLTAAGRLAGITKEGMRQRIAKDLPELYKTIRNKKKVKST